MAAERRLRENTVILFVVGFLALNYPLLSIFDAATLVLGVPLLYVYLFLVWLALIVATAVVVQRHESPVGSDRTDARGP